MSALPDSGSVIGIDVGWSESRASSAICRLDWTDTRLDWTIRRFRAIAQDRRAAIHSVADRPALAAAFDGPLASGLCRIGAYRMAEQMLTLGFRAIGKPGQSNSPNGKMLNDHANLCALIVQDLGCIARATHEHAIHARAIVEAFPTSFMGVLVENPAALSIKRGRRSDRYFDALAKDGGLARVMGHLLPAREPMRDLSDVMNHDDRAAFICALSALCVAAGDYTTVGDERGWIILPPERLIAPWAREQFTINANRTGAVFAVADRARPAT